MPLDRREFLRESKAMSAAAIGVAAFIHSAPGQAGRILSPNESLNLAMIGVGGRGGGLMNWAFAHRQATITAVCDVNRRQRARATEAIRNAQGSKPKTYGDFRELLNDKTIDAVVVATPHHWHAPIAVQALNAGKHVYVEKPASHVLREGRVLVDAARRNRRIVQHGTQMRSSEVTREAAKVLKSGILGEIRQSKAWGVEPRSFPSPVPDSRPPAELDYPFWLGPAPERAFNRLRFSRWNSFRDYGNGEIGGDGIHDIDLARWGLGVQAHPVRITAIGSAAHLKEASEFPDNLTATYEYADGRVLIYENRNFAPYKMHGWDNGNIFFGTEGYMLFSRRGYFQTYLGAAEKKGPGMQGGTGNQEHVHNFIDSVLADKQPNADVETAHLSCGIVHLGEIAYRTGRVLNFDPKTERIQNDAAADALLTKTYRSPWAFDT